LCIVGLSGYAALAAPNAKPGGKAAAGTPSATIVRSGVDIVALPRVPTVYEPLFKGCTHTICLNYGQGGFCAAAPQYFTDCVFVDGVCTTRVCPYDGPPVVECDGCE
jgi:hypothetical protein